MNEQLQSKLVEILAGIQSATKAAGDFAMEQLPDIAQSYVMYGRFQSLFAIACGIGLAVLGWRLLSSVRTHIKKNDDLLDADPLVIVFGGGCAALMFGAGFVWTYKAASFAALVWFAPKVWLLKELASLIK